MEGDFLKKTSQTEEEFEWQGTSLRESAKIIVNGYGIPIYAGYGLTHGWYAMYPESSDFVDAVKKVMNILLENDTEEFKRMRNALNQKYKKMAEEIRLEKLNKYNF